MLASPPTTERTADLKPLKTFKVFGEPVEVLTDGAFTGRVKSSAATTPHLNQPLALVYTKD
jgi:hypothetical protein